ncbi:uncharacterized protein [Lepeophtheirus salmonis]|uniref:Uncharacterized protein n=1 Tax=Lepeophtheirus salmonis TaxID=72036 RepID=A0A0K2TU95_LEPSM|nr:uncharacterized protein LOC121128587 [Lepeophtheirus salmonis]XP_040580112.1 uncharacterized protein LOC121128587 [Lepeophtheirus salmonis]
MLLGHGSNTMTMDEAKIKLCTQAKILGLDCNPMTLKNKLHHQNIYGHQEILAQQSKDAIIYVTIVVVFYIAVVLLLIGTNLKAGKNLRSAKFKSHVVEFNEKDGSKSKLVPSNKNGNTVDFEDDIVDV